MQMVPRSAVRLGRRWAFIAYSAATARSAAEAGSKLEPAPKAAGRKTTPVSFKVTEQVWLEKRK